MAYYLVQHTQKQRNPILLGQIILTFNFPNASSESCFGSVGSAITIAF
jgi:hypothetical protein